MNTKESDGLVLANNAIFFFKFLDLFNFAKKISANIQSDY